MKEIKNVWKQDKMVHIHFDKLQEIHQHRLSRSYHFIQMLTRVEIYIFIDFIISSKYCIHKWHNRYYQHWIGRQSPNSSWGSCIHFTLANLVKWQGRLDPLALVGQSVKEKEDSKFELSANTSWVCMTGLGPRKKLL